MKEFEIILKISDTVTYKIEAENESEAIAEAYSGQGEVSRDPGETEVVSVEEIEKLKKFKVVLRRTELITYEVEAADEDEASDIVYRNGDGEVDRDEENSEIDYVEEIKN